MRILFIFLALFISSVGFSQSKSKFIYAHISDKSVTLTPFYKVFGSNFDPAITIGAEFDHVVKPKSTLFQNFEGTYYSHALTGGGVSLSSSLGYRFMIHAGFFAEAMVGVMGSGFISGRETFSLNENGEYEKVSPVHWTVGVPFDLGVGYSFGRYSFYLRYRYQVEGRYTGILPFIPASYLGVGVRYSVLGIR